MNRGVGYCDNTNCDDFWKGVFILNGGTTFYCPRCRHNGHVAVEERDNVVLDDTLYTMVKVNYNYEPGSRTYLEQAIVKFEPERAGAVYVYSSPLIKTQGRALKVGETLISALNSGSNTDDLLKCETVLSFDVSREEFGKSLEAFKKRLTIRERRLNEQR